MPFEKDRVYIYNKSKASSGFRLFWTIGTTVAKLRDMQGNIDWKIVGLSRDNVYLLRNGAHGRYHKPSEGSRIFEIDLATNETVWEYSGSPRRLVKVSRNEEILWNYNSTYASDIKPHEPLSLL